MILLDPHSQFCLIYVASSAYSFFNIKYFVVDYEPFNGIFIEP